METALSRPLISRAARHMLAATLWFSIMNVFIRKVNHLPEMEVVFFRCLTPMLWCFISLHQKQINWLGSNRKLLLLRGLFGTVSLYAFIMTIHHMPLGTAVTIQYLSPVFTTIAAIFILKEHVKWMQWLFFLVSFSGIALIKGIDERVSMFYLFVGIFSAIFSALAYNMVRSLKQREHPLVVVLHFQIFGVVAGFIFMLFNWQTPQGLDWLYLLLIGVCTQLGQINLTQALQKEKISSISMLNYLGILYALFFGYLFFGETYGWVSLAGMILVIAGVLTSVIFNTSIKQKVELKNYANP
ncbi:MAG: DMT family transporter [Chitinophagales bacterium]